MDPRARGVRVAGVEKLREKAKGKREKAIHGACLTGFCFPLSPFPFPLSPFAFCLAFQAGSIPFAFNTRAAAGVVRWSSSAFAATGWLDALKMPATDTVVT